ncbi:MULTISPECIES: glucose-6-phosphate dehydrogenase [Acidithrix]|uniref:Glucose-6-phosphate 1-dehydrogenase n=1 Tax=Acidithrix ferrooxidans TaxID=1280514 RepID=A0A0D8HP95_9ACTN|nr:MULTISPECIES: glucose-6-phosphate dehydrogenase [Acidithrix]KJF18931.1 glucose-6-phosphate 1-dehydrogenase [Acidithrix ferrooxidans]
MKPQDQVSDQTVPTTDALFVLFGAMGDLAKRKLIPGLYHLYLAGLMPKDFRIIGTSPTEIKMETQLFQTHVHESLANFGRKEIEEESFSIFSKKISYIPADTTDFSKLQEAIHANKAALSEGAKTILYLAIPPPAFIPVIDALGASGIAKEAQLVIEKPFGSDLATAKELNSAIHRSFDEESVYRIDHFLGKEAVQNILALRFANGIFEPSWNHDSIDYVQIDIPETLTIEGRGAFYEKTGAFRDMVVTHLFQVLGFLAMDPPERLDGISLNKAKTSLFKAMRPITKDDVIYGQYAGYLDQPGVAPNSCVETFVACRIWIDNDRWAGVPFYLRTGKAMATGRWLLTLGFKVPDLNRFHTSGLSNEHSSPNELVIDMADPGSIEINFMTKKPGPSLTLASASLNFNFLDNFNVAYELEAYERLIHDVMIGDRALFNEAEGIETLWEASAPLISDPPRPLAYEQGSYGPPEALETLISPYRWYLH